MSLTAKDIETITRLLEASSFDELELEIEGVKLSLRRRGAVSPAGGSAAAPVAESAPVPAVQGGAPALAPSAVPAASLAPPVGADVLTAPLLGTFYRSPRPGEPPFVEVGAAVAADTVIGIIEVMKLMNAVHAGRKGRVAEILAQDGALVEYGQALLRIEA